jgi:hypothetical protein
MIENLLYKLIGHLKEDIQEVNGELEPLKLKLHTLQMELTGAIGELQKVCKHPSSHRVDGSYFPAGFDYYSESNYTIVCDSCGKVLESKSIRGSHFG